MNIAMVQPMKTYKLRPGASRSMGGNEEMFVIFRELLRRGHRVTVYTKISTFDLRRGMPEGLEGLRYEPEAPIARDEDAVLMNNGTWVNLIGGTYKPDGSTTIAFGYFKRAIELMKDYRGWVVYHQSDMERFFNILQNVDRLTGVPSRLHMRQDFGYTNESVWGGIRSHVLLKTPVPDELGRSLRATYDYYDKDEHTTFGEWNCSHFVLDFLEKVEPLPVEYPLVYTGHRRSRPRLKMYYNRDDAHVFGNWDAGTSRQDVFPNANYHGKINVGEVADKLSRGGATVVVVDKRAEGYGWLPARVFEAVWAGCPVLLDEKIWRPDLRKHNPFSHLTWDFVTEPRLFDGHLEHLLKNREEVVDRQRTVLSEEFKVERTMDKLEDILKAHPAWEAI